MKQIKIDLGTRSYRIYISSHGFRYLKGILPRLSLGQEAVIITNSLINRLWGKELNIALKGAGLDTTTICVPDTESSKSFACAASVIRKLAKTEKKKRFLVAFGGGVIGDMAGFVASIYRRGIAYIQIPTTLLAQIDSSIGGKTGIDLNEGKNLVGAFYQPRLVYTNLATLKSLKMRQLREGIAEAIKYAVIKDARLFAFLESHLEELFQKDIACLSYVVWACARIKATITQQDEREERGVRTILNFGHTFAHALEAASRYKVYSHGEAVGLGMVCALDIALRLGMIQRGLHQRIEKLIQKVGLPTKAQGLDKYKFLECFWQDKKFKNKTIRMVLPEKLAKVIVSEDIKLALIKDTIRGRFL